MSNAPEILHSFAYDGSLPRTWLSAPGVELVEDVGVAADGLLIHRPLRLVLDGAVGTLILRLRPLDRARRRIDLWTSPETEGADWFQALNQRVQQHEPHLRRLPDMYLPAAWEPAEWDAVTPTQRREGQLRASGWSLLVLSWSADGTRAWLDGVPIAEATGLPHRLYLAGEAIEDFHSLAAVGHWQRQALLRGVALSHAALLATPLDEAGAAALAPWRSEDALRTALGAASTVTSTDQVHDSALIETLYAAATGIRLRSTDCEPVDATAQPGPLRLDLRDADRERYWHYGALRAIGGQCLYAIPQGTVVRWSFRTTEPGQFTLVLHAQQLMPWPDATPRLELTLDEQPLGSVALPCTSAAGSMRPEAAPFKPIPTGLTVDLEPGWHSLSLTVYDSPHLAIDELLLTPDALALPTPDSGYRRPPAMAVTDLQEGPDGTVYTLRFSGPHGGVLSVDPSSDPGPAPRLSTDLLRGGSDAESEGETVRLHIPRDPAAATTTAGAADEVRRIRLVVAVAGSSVRMVYPLRHRRPFARAPRPQRLAPTWLDRSLPATPSRHAEQLAKLRDNPPPKDHHSDARLRRLALIAWLSGDAADLDALRSTLLEIATSLPARPFGLLDGETRADVRGDYGGARRGSQFGEIWPEDAFAYDLLMARGRLSSHDQAIIEANLFWPGLENSKRQFGGELGTRGQAHSVVAAVLAGIVLEDEPMLREAEDAMIRFGSSQILPDGGHNEKSSSYGASVKTLVDVAAFLLDQGRPRVFETCRATIRAICDVPLAAAFSNGALLRQGDGGLQATYHIFGCAEMLATACRLFPDDAELRRTQANFARLHARLSAKWEHLPPAEWPVLPADYYRASDLFPVSGWAILRSAPGSPNRLEASLDWSAFGDHGHPDALNLSLNAFDETISMDLGYGWTADAPRCQNYAMRTVSHNTVVADGHDQLPGGRGALRLFAHEPELQVCWADAGRRYADGIRADRCLLLLGDTLVDLFHLAGGRRHRYDWLFHCLGALSVDLPLAARGPLCPPCPPLERVADLPGYDHLANLREGVAPALASASAAPPIRARWAIDGYHQLGWANAEKRWFGHPTGTLHLDLLGAPETTVIAGDAPYPLPSADSRRPFLMVRREARAATFAAVYQARHDDAPPATVRALPVTLRGRPLAAHQATALEIRSPDRCITVLQRHVAGPLSAGPIHDSFADLEVRIDTRRYAFQTQGPAE